GICATGIVLYGILEDRRRLIRALGSQQEIAELACRRATIPIRLKGSPVGLFSLIGLAPFFLDGCKIRPRRRKPWITHYNCPVKPFGFLKFFLVLVNHGQ